jgi:HNH endonuclease
MTALGRRWRNGWRLGYISWAVPLGAAGWVWSDMREAGKIPGLATVAVLFVLAWPLVILAVVYGPFVVIGGAVPRGSRKWWRRRMAGRPAIPLIIRRGVYGADRYRCLYCGSARKLQLDHIFPWSLGGLTSLWNLAVLCGRCNRVKSNYWRYRSGLVVYRAWEGSEDARTAALILACEKRARWNIFRWLRAARALGVV